MNVVYSTDENYSKICMTSLYSLLESNKMIKEIEIYIIDNNLNEKTKKQFTELIKKYNREIKFISCKEICEELQKNNDFPVSAYARLFIQDYIKDDKIIYIDCDTIVNGSLEELWTTKLDDYWIAGVQDPLPNYLKKTSEMDENDRYINSGVLLINLKKWREVDFKNLVVQYITNHKKNVVHHDQGIINGICNGKILYLHPKFNLMPEMISMNEKKLKKLYQMKEFYSQKELDEAKSKPIIIHYILKFYNRPWFKECTHPYKDKFLKFYKILNGKLISKPLSYKVRLRKFVFNYFHFNVYVSLERILDYKRKKSIKKIYKEGE